MDTLHGITQAPLPACAQAHLARTGSPEARTSLAASVHLDPDVASTLLTGRNIAAFRRAVRVASDTDAVNAAARGTGPNACAALRNPRVDRQILADAVTSPIGEVALSALVNPSTPAEARRSALTPGAAARICQYGSSAADAAIRGQMLAHANPWTAEDPAAWPAAVQRGIAQLPGLNEDTARALHEASRGRWGATGKHPALTHGGTGIPTTALLGLGNAAADVVALTRRDLTERMLANALVDRYDSDADAHVDYYVLARAVARFGPTVAWHVEGRLSYTRVNAAAAAVPAAGLVGYVSPHEIAATDEAIGIVGTDSDAWETFMRLLPGWDQSLPELARAVMHL